MNHTKVINQCYIYKCAFDWQKKLSVASYQPKQCFTKRFCLSAYISSPPHHISLGSL